LLQTNVNTFIDANYAWLSGKTPTPQFSLDFVGAKQDFATKVGDYVQTHLASLPICTAQQQAVLQIPIDPLTVTCRPAALNPKAEGARVAQEVSSGKFLSQPVVTPTSLGHDQSSPNQKPYYQGLSKLPQLYRLSQKLPFILTIVSLLSAVAIFLVAPERRRGLRRIGVVFSVAGLILLITKFIADGMVNRLDDQIVSKSGVTELQPATKTFLHNIESQLTQTNLWFGIIFLVIGVAIIIYLYMTKAGSRKPKPLTSSHSPLDTPRPSSPEETDPRDIHLAPRRTPTGPPTDIMPPRPLSTPTSPTPPSTAPEIKKPKRPRLIQ